MNETARTGIKRAIGAAWDYLPQVLVASIIAITVFVFGLWDTVRDHSTSIVAIKNDQCQTRLCERIHGCTTIDRIEGAIAECRTNNERFISHADNAREAGQATQQRIIRLEGQVYEMRSSPSARPDPFTGSMGRELRERIEALEGMK